MTVWGKSNSFWTIHFRFDPNQNESVFRRGIEDCPQHSTATMDSHIVMTRRSGMFRVTETRKGVVPCPFLSALSLNEGAPSLQGHLRLEWEEDQVLSAWSPENWWKKLPPSLKGDILEALGQLLVVEDSTNRLLRRGEFAQIESAMRGSRGLGHWHANIRLCECEEQELVDARRAHDVTPNGGFLVDFRWSAGLATQESWFEVDEDKDKEEDPNAPEIDVSIDPMD
jgi:hypothetical protein